MLIEAFFVALLQYRWPLGILHGDCRPIVLVLVLVLVLSEAVLVLVLVLDALALIRPRRGPVDAVAGDKARGGGSDAQPEMTLRCDAKGLRSRSTVSCVAESPAECRG